MVERRLCPYDDRCWTDGFCITATSSKTPWPCESDWYTGDPVEIYQNETLIARDLSNVASRIVFQVKGQ